MLKKRAIIKDFGASTLRIDKLYKMWLDYLAETDYPIDDRSEMWKDIMISTSLEYNTDGT